MLLSTRDKYKVCWVMYLSNLPALIQSYMKVLDAHSHFFFLAICNKQDTFATSAYYSYSHSLFKRCLEFQFPL